MKFDNVRNVRAFLSDYYLGNVFGRGGGRKKRLSDRDTNAAYARFRRTHEQAQGRVTDSATGRERLLRPLFRDVFGFHLGSGEEGLHGLYTDAEREAQGDKPLALIVCGTWDEQPDASGRDNRSLVRRLEEALARHDVPYGFVGTGEEIRLFRRPGDGPRGAYLGADLQGLIEADDPESFAVVHRLFHASMLTPDDTGRVPLQDVESESRGHAQQVSEDLKRAVFSAAEALVGALLEDATRRGEVDLGAVVDRQLRTYRDAAFTALYRLLFILYAEARDPRLDEHPIYRTAYSVQGLLEQILRDGPTGDNRLPENSAGYWARLRTLFRIYDEGLPAITPYQHLPPRGGDFFGRTSSEGQVLERARIPDRHVAWILTELATTAPRVGVGRERVSFRELDIEQLGSVYEGLLEYEPKVASSTHIELRVQGRAFVLDASDVVRLCAQKSLVLRGDRGIVVGTEADALHPDAEAEEEDESDEGDELSTEADADEPDDVSDDSENDADDEKESAIKRGATALLVRRLPPGTFHFIPGAARKGSGSYYTPLPLVRDLVWRALGPVVSGKSPEEIESVRVLDPACGSGHFLIEAMRYLGRELHRAWVRDLSGTAPPSFRGTWDADCDPSDSEARAANSEARAWCKRRIAERCLFGVDRNPTAVNLARVALWIESLAGDRPLTYFEHHIRTGNSLLGSWMEALDRPPLPGMPGGRLSGQTDIFAQHVRQLVVRAAEARLIIDRAGDLGSVEPESIEEQKFKAQQRMAAERILGGARLLFDLRTASAFLPEIWNEWQVLCGFVDDAARLEGYGGGRPWWNEFKQIRDRERFFHWELEFPEILRTPERPGFDAVLGNPPWDKVLPTKHDFYAAHDVLIRAFKGNELDRRIRELNSTIPGLAQRFGNYRSNTTAAAHLLRKSGDFPLSESRSGAAHEDVSKYFVDRAARLCIADGAVGFVVPSVVYNGDGCVGIRRFLLEKTTIEQFYGFENRKKLFPIDSRYKYVNLVFRKSGRTDVFDAAFMRHDPAELESSAAKPWMVRMRRDDIERLSPETLAFLEYRGPEDQAIVQKMHRDRPTLGGHEPGSWGTRFVSWRAHEIVYNSAEDKDLWTDRESGRIYSPKDIVGDVDSHNFADAVKRMRDSGFWPVFEGKQVDQFVVGFKPVRWWLRVAQAREKYGREPRVGSTLVLRRIARNTDERTSIAAVLPSYSAASEQLPALICDNVDPESGCSVLNSFAFDYLLRFRNAGSTLAFTYLAPLAVPNAQAVAGLPSLQTQHAWEHAIRRISDDVNTWPALWSSNRGVAEAYGLDAHDFDHILNTFPVFARKRSAFFRFLRERVAEWKAETLAEPKEFAREQLHA